MQVIAHRGARLLAVENTIDALRVAWQEGADAVEVDVQLTSDGELVVFHDGSLRRWSGDDTPISRCRWRDLRGVNLRDENGHTGNILHFDELLEHLQSAPGWCNIELKVDFDAEGHQERLAETVAQALDTADEVPGCAVSSFSKIALVRFAQACPHVPVAPLIDEAPDAPWSFLAAVTHPGWAGEIGATQAILGDRWDAVHPHGRVVGQAQLQAWADLKLEVRPWVVNGPKHWQLCVVADVSGAITDDPGGLRRFLETDG